MKHKVTCANCGKKSIIEVTAGKAPPKGWFYYGRINVNSFYTDKYLYEVKDIKNISFSDKFKKVENKNYNPKIKPKWIEIWEHERCPG